MDINLSDKPDYLWSQLLDENCYGGVVEDILTKVEKVRMTKT